MLRRLGKLVFFCIIYFFKEMKICLGLIFILYGVRVVPEHFCFCNSDGCVIFVEAYTPRGGCRADDFKTDYPFIR